MPDNPDVIPYFSADSVRKAADQIEANPEDYNFSSIRTPSGCGSPGCVMGWIAYFEGHPAGKAFPWLNTSVERELYDSLSEIRDKHHIHVSWTDDAKITAFVLRLYADEMENSHARS